MSSKCLGPHHRFFHLLLNRTVDMKKRHTAHDRANLRTAATGAEYQSPSDCLILISQLAQSLSTQYIDGGNPFDIVDIPLNFILLNDISPGATAEFRCVSSLWVELYHDSEESSLSAQPKANSEWGPYDFGATTSNSA